MFVVGGDLTLPTLEVYAHPGRPTSDSPIFVKKRSFRFCLNLAYDYCSNIAFSNKSLRCNKLERDTPLVEKQKY